MMDGGGGIGTGKWICVPAIERGQGHICITCVYKKRSNSTRVVTSRVWQIFKETRKYERNEMSDREGDVARVRVEVEER